MNPLSSEPDYACSLSDRALACRHQQSDNLFVLSANLEDAQAYLTTEILQISPVEALFLSAGVCAVNDRRIPANLVLSGIYPDFCLLN